MRPFIHISNTIASVSLRIVCREETLRAKLAMEAKENEGRQMQKVFNWNKPFKEYVLKVTVLRLAKFIGKFIFKNLD